MAKIVHIGNKIYEIDNRTGTKKLLAERPLENTRVRKDKEGWHVRFTGERKDDERQL